MRPIRTARELGMVVRRARSDRGWTQSDLATRAEVGRPWLSELERGKPTAELGKVLSVIAALDLVVMLEPRPPITGDIDLDELF